MGRLSAIFTIIGGVLGSLTLVFTLFGSNGAPQQAAGAAISIALVAVPYCFGRAMFWAAYPQGAKD